MLHREEGRQILRQQNGCRGIYFQLSCICNLAGSVGACHSRRTPVPQLAVNWAKSTTMPQVSLPLPLWYLPSLFHKLLFFQPTFFFFFSEYRHPPPLFQIFFSTSLLLSFPSHLLYSTVAFYSTHSQKTKARWVKGRGHAKIPNCIACLENREWIYLSLLLPHSPSLLKWIKLKLLW